MSWKTDVWAQVEAFRAQFLTGDLAYLPVDVIPLARFDRESIWPDPNR